MEVILITLIFTVLMGPALASFFSVVVMRMEGITEAKGDFSVDDTSGERLKWFEMIPIFSFLALRGKSRYTQEKLDVRMFFAEILGLLIFGILAAGGYHEFSTTNVSNFEFLFSYLIFLVFSIGMFFLAVYDLFTYSIPAEITKYLTYGAVLVNIGIGLLKFIPNLDPYLSFLYIGSLDTLLAGAIAGAFIMALIFITRQKGMGEGDVYIAVIMGVMLGLQRLLGAFYITLFTATAIGLIMMAIKRKFVGLIVPLVPFMTIGFVAAIYFGKPLVNYLFLGSLGV